MKFAEKLFEKGFSSFIRFTENPPKWLDKIVKADYLHVTVFLPGFITFFGILAVPYFLSGSHKNDHSGDGSLPFGIAAIGAMIGTLGGGILSIPAALLGIPVILAFPVLYYLTLVAVSLLLFTR